MPSLSSTYLLPAIILNPAFILHLINTLVSYLAPPPLTPSVSPHPVFESLGPVPGSTPYLNMHTDDQLCWRYTAIMVVVQLVAFGRVQDNRGRRKMRVEEKREGERRRREKLRVLQQERGLGKVGLDGMCEMLEECDGCAVGNGNGYANGRANGRAGSGKKCDGGREIGRISEGRKSEGGVVEEIENAGTPESEYSLTETSEEEEMIV